MGIPTLAENQFWTVIDQARSGKSASTDPSCLKEILSSFDNDSVAEFGRIFYEKICDLNQWRLWVLVM
jgi:Protein of unknown function (DUF4240)